MVTSFYAALFTLIMCYLAFQVIKVRKKEKVLYADGGNTKLQQVRTAQLNAYENIPIFLVLLLLLELNQGPIVLLHILGLIMLSGRIIHAMGVLMSKLKFRILGMSLTFSAIVAAAICNLAFMPFDKIFAW